MVFEFSLLCCLSIGGLWRRYPYFCSYVLFFVIQSIVLFILLRWVPGSYASWYWRTGTINLCARFLVVGEIFRQIFPAQSPLRQMVSKAFAAMVLLVGSLAGGMF